MLWPCLIGSHFAPIFQVSPFRNVTLGFNAQCVIILWVILGALEVSAVIVALRAGLFASMHCNVGLCTLNNLLQTIKVLLIGIIILFEYLVICVQD